MIIQYIGIKVNNVILHANLREEEEDILPTTLHIFFLIICKILYHAAYFCSKL